MTNQMKVILMAQDKLRQSKSILLSIGYTENHPQIADIHSAIERLSTDLFAARHSYRYEAEIQHDMKSIVNGASA